MTRIHTSSNAVVYLLVAAVTGLAGGGIVPANAATSNDGAYTPFATEAISHIGSTAYADIFGNNQRRLADPASLLKALAASQEPLRASRLGAVTLANGWADLALRTIALNNPAAYGGQVGQTEAVLDALAPCWPQSTTQPDDRTDPAASPTISSDPTTSALPNHDTGPLPAAAASAGLQPTNWPGQPAIVGLVEQPTATAASLADLDFQIRQANPALPANPDLAIQTDKSPVIYTTYRLTVQGGACGEKTTDTAYGLVVALHDPTLAFVNNGQILGSGIAPNHTTWADAANDTNSSGLSMQTTDFPPRYSQGVTNQSGVSLTVQQTLPSNSQLTLSEQIADSNLHKFATAIGSDTPATHQIPLLSETNQQFNLTLGANALFGEAAATSRSITVSNQTDSPATVTLPAHTALEIAEIGRLETAKLDHDIPLAIGYQVTVVEWNTATDLNHTLAHFGSATDDAHSDLEMRRNKSDDSEIMWTSQSASLDDPAKQILDKLQHAPLISAQTAWSGNLGKDLAGLVTGRPMIRVPAQLVHQIRSSTRSVAKIIPLYPLARTASPTLGTVELNSGQRLALDQLSVTGYDADDIPFYGFNVRNGSWTLTDDSGRPLDNDNTEGVATISHQPFTGNSYLVAGSKLGTVHLVYRVSPDAYQDRAGHSLVSPDIINATIEVAVTPPPFAGSIELRGSLTGYTNDPPIDLNSHANGLNVTVYDSSGRQVVNPVIWESREIPGRGVNITNGLISFTQAGLFQIRARIDQVASAWVTVTALPSREAANLEIADTALLLNPTKAEPVNLSNLLLSAHDQYGAALAVPAAQVTWTISNASGEVISGTGDFVFTPPGEGLWTVEATVGQATSNPLELRVGNPTVLISFDTAGGTPISPQPFALRRPIGQLPIPSKAGHTFSAWLDDHGLPISPATLATEAITVHASWDANNYWVTFDPAGGTPVAPVERRFGSPIGELPQSTRTGYAFVGWVDAEGTMVSPATIMSGQLDLTAQWWIKLFSVSFNTAGGNKIEPWHLIYNTPLGALPTPTRYGWSFDGWHDADGRLVSSTTRLTEPLTLIAHWVPARYAITFNSVGGSDCAPISAEHGARIGQLPTPQRQHYSFAGWVTASAESVGENFIVTEPMVLVATWHPLPYRVVFNPAGGSDVLPRQVSYGTAIGQLPVTTRQGHRFVRWYDDAGRTVDRNTMVLGAITVTAQWQVAAPPNSAKQRLSIVFKANGGRVKGHSKYTRSVQPGKTLGKLPAAKRSNYQFAGWFTAKHGGKRITAKTKLTTNRTIYAHWNR